MDEIREEFENYVDEFRRTLRAGELTGADGERAQNEAEELIREYRSKLRAEEEPSRGREMLEHFREAVARI